MLFEPLLTSRDLELFGQLTTCQVADAIDTQEIRLRNEGFVNGNIQCMFPNLRPITGYAVPAQIRTSSPPMVDRDYPDRADWWKYLVSIPAPRVVLLEDLDEPPGRGSCAGEVHAHIYRALGCVGIVTNGAVRDLEAVGLTGLSFFAARVAVSTAYYHMTGFGFPVQVGGLKVAAGDLLHGDRHGVISIPPKLAREIPAIAAEISELERRVINVADSPNPSIEALSEAVRQSVREGRFRR